MNATMSMNFKTLILLVSLSCCSELFSMNRFTRIRSTSGSGSENGWSDAAPSPRGLEAEAPSPFEDIALRTSCCCKLWDKLCCVQRTADKVMAYGYSYGITTVNEDELFIGGVPENQTFRRYQRAQQASVDIDYFDRPDFPRAESRRLADERQQVVTIVRLITMVKAVPIVLGVHSAVKFLTQHQKMD